MPVTDPPSKRVEQLDRMVIRFAGDSGDGMQLTGDRFTSETVQLGNDISMLSNFPAEIRAPAGTLPGVLSFQVHFADYDILTSGDAPNVLVATNPAALKANLAALGGEATFVARTIDPDRKHLQSVLRAAADHQGSAFVEIYQNCNIFNDGAFELIKDAGSRDDHLIRLEHGQPVTFGARGQYAVTHLGGAFGLAISEGGEPIVHDTTVDEPAYAFALTRLSGSDLGTTPIGVFRDGRRPTYDEPLHKQLAGAKATAGGTPEVTLDDLLHNADIWRTRSMP